MASRFRPPPSIAAETSFSIAAKSRSEVGPFTTASKITSAENRSLAENRASLRVTCSRCA